MTDEYERAFPRPVSEADRVFTSAQKGMTLLDWFAGQALIGIVASADEHDSPEGLAGAAFLIAHAMMEESAKQ